MSSNSSETNKSIKTTGHLEYYSQLNGSLCGEEVLLCNGNGHRFVITAGSIQGQDPISKTYIARGCGRALIESTSDINSPQERTFTISAFRECGGISALMYAPQCESVFYEAMGCDPSAGDFDMITVFHGENPQDVEVTPGSLTDVNTKLVDSKTYSMVCSYVIAKIQFVNITFEEVVVDEVYFGEAACSAGDGCGCSSAGGHGMEKIAKLLDGPTLAYSVDGGENFLELDLTAEIPAGSTVVAIEKASSGLIITTQAATGDSGYLFVPYSGLGTCGAEGCNTSPVFIADQFATQPTDVAVSGRNVFWSGMAGAIYMSQQASVGNAIQVGTGLSTVDFTRIDANGSTVVAVGADNGGTAPNGIVYSQNGGSTWSPATNPPGFPGYALTSIAVKSANVWEVGTDTGLIFRTCDGGCTWSQILSVAGPVDDIAYATDQVGYAVTSTAAGAVDVLYTWNGGADWLQGNCDTRGCDFESCERVAYAGNASGHHGYRIAIPSTGNLFVRANHVLIGGGTANGGGCQAIGTPKYTEGK